MKKTILGHSHHTPAIAKGTYQVGIKTKSPVYGSGPATWQQGHVIVYPNGTIVRTGFKMRKEDLAATYRELYGGYSQFAANFPPPRRREAIEHTRQQNKKGDE